MTANLSGIRFDQIYGDNSGGGEFDTDGDGTATQEDEFVSFTNDSGTAVDISGWQIWSDMTGAGAPDGPQDSLYHTFPPGTTLTPGQTLYIVNEITGIPPSWAQEASEGGVESSAGGTNTNFISEGAEGADSESLVLVDPSTGNYIVFNMSTSPSAVPSLSGFPGTSNVGEVDGHSVQADQNAGSSYRYNSGTDGYDYTPVSVPCMLRGTLIDTPAGPRRIETLQIGDMVTTLDYGPQPVRWVGRRRVDISIPGFRHHAPIRIAQDGKVLVVSPQHRMLTQCGHLAPAKGLVHLQGLRRDRSRDLVDYFHLLFDQHCIIFANGFSTESLLPGDTYLNTAGAAIHIALAKIGSNDYAPARPCLSVAQSRRLFPEGRAFLHRHDCPSREASLLHS